MTIMSRLAVALAVVLTGCHLADSPDPVKCDPGTHPSDGHCVNDPVSAVTVTVSPGQGGAACTVSPASISVAVNGKFEIDNKDTVDHLITGADGQSWATVKAGQLSPLIGIAKAGSFAYTVSGCANGGTVVVE